MKVFITKFKGQDNRPCNYFQAWQPVVYLDDFVMPKQLLYEYPDFNEEFLIEDTPLSFTSSDFEIRMSLILNFRSRSGKTLAEFFLPETDGYIPVGYKVCWGPSETLITHDGFIDVTSIKVNERKDGDPSGQVTSFKVIGSEEHYIQWAEKHQAPADLPYDDHTLYGSWLSGLLTNPQVFKNITFSNSTFFRFNSANMNPKINPFIHNRWVEGASKKDRWNVFSSFQKDHGMVYKLIHPGNVVPNTIQNYVFKLFFLSDSNGSAPEPKVHRDADKIKSISLQFAREHLGFFYVEYTAPELASQHWYGGLYMSRNETTISYSNLDGGGLIIGNQANMFQADDRNYSGWVIRNGIAMKLDDMVRNGERVLIYRSNGIDQAASIGRSLVLSYNATLNSDSGFNLVVARTAAAELKYFVSGIKKAYDLDIYFPEGSAHRIMRKMPYSGGQWLIHKVSNVDTFGERAKIRVVQA